MRPTEAKKQPCDTLTAINNVTEYMSYEYYGLPPPQEGMPYPPQQVPQLLTVQQQPSWYNPGWALQQYWQQQQSWSPPPLWSPTSWDQPWAASGATTASAAGKYPIWHGFGPSTHGEHVDSTQGVYVDSFYGSDKKKNRHRKLLGKKNLRTIKKDLRGGVSRCSIWQPHTPLLVGEV